MTENPAYPSEPKHAQPPHAPARSSQDQYFQPRHSAGSYHLPASNGLPGPPSKRSRKIPIIVGAVAAGLLLIGGGVTALLMTVRSDTGQQMAAAVGMPVGEQRSPFQDVQARCDLAGKGTTIADKGKTLIVDSSGEEDYTGISYTSVTCIFNAISMPTAVQAHVGDTRALDGRQEDSWDGFTASWTYHPDEGMDMIVRVA